ncbi:MAG: AAA family ATPase [bacterium]
MKKMTVISLLNQKGGVGKTTLAIHLADLMAKSICQPNPLIKPWE